MRKFSILILMLLCFAGCELLEDPPEGHTIDKDGVWHKPGLENPTENCVQCHGENLNGGTSGVACYDCHNKLP